MISVPKLSFTGGIWSPSLQSRSDLEKYNTAAREMLNMFCRPFGGVSNRGGTTFISEIKDSSKTVKLKPFQFSNIQAYVLEFGDQYIRVFKDGALVVNAPGNGTDIVKDGVYKWTASGHGTNEYRLELAAGGNPGLADPEYVFSDVGGSDTSLPKGTLGSLTAGSYGYGDNDSLGYSTIYVRLSDGTDPDTKDDGYLEASYIYEIATDYIEADLPLVKVRQKLDVMYICHPSYPTMKLSRTGHDVWTLTEVSFEAAIAAPTGLACGGTGTRYKVTAIGEGWVESFVSVAEEGAPANALTWSAVTGAIYYRVYKEYPFNSGMYFALDLVKGDVNTYTEVSGGKTPDLTQGAPEDNANLDTADNYPGSCVFHEGRLVFLRTNNKPNTMFGSNTDDFEKMGISAPIADDDSYEHTLDSDKAKEIKWGEKLGTYLLLGTSDSEVFASPSGADKKITPSSIYFDEKSKYGVSDVLPIKVDTSLLFIENSGKVVRDYVYNYEIDSYSGDDLSMFANHLFDGKKIVAWCYQRNPNSIVWCVLDDGTLLGMTYNKKQSVWGWHRHNTQGFFEDIIELDEGTGVNNVYCVVRRYVDGEYKRYIELFNDRLVKNSLGQSDVKNSHFLDCALSWDNPVNITDITLGTVIVIETEDEHGLANGDIIEIDELATLNDAVGDIEFGTYELNGKKYYVADADADSFTLKDKNGNYIDGSEYTPYLSGGKIRKAIKNISGLNHLEGKKVNVLADGKVKSNLTVTNGAVVIPFYASRIEIGLGYVNELESVDFDTVIEGGIPLRDRQSVIPTVLVQVEDTRTLNIGPSLDRCDTNLLLRKESDGENTVQLSTGDYELAIETGYYRQNRICVRNTLPLPITINGVIARIEYGEN